MERGKERIEGMAEGYLTTKLSCLMSVAAAAWKSPRVAPTNIQW